MDNMREEYLSYLVAAILVLLTAAVAGYQIICHLCTEGTLVNRIVSTDTDKTLPWSHNFLATSCKIKTILQPYQCDVTLKLSVDSFWCGSS